MILVYMGNNHQNYFTSFFCQFLKQWFQFFSLGNLITAVNQDAVFIIKFQYKTITCPGRQKMNDAVFFCHTLIIYLSLFLTDTFTKQ